MDTQSIQRVFDAQQVYQHELALTSVKQRRQKLKQLLAAILAHREQIRQALWQDYKKPAAEVDLTEIYVVTSEIKHSISQLGRWMRAQRVGTPLPLMGSSSWVKHEPKGVCLIIAPWNYPVQLSLGPLVSAIAAGNTVMLKPSEHAPHSAQVIKQILSSVFEEKEVAVFEGEVAMSTALLKLPFNHIFFTGSPAVGKIVMKAAAEHLASVTLELGGKSPTIVDDTADIRTAAKRIAWGKFSNNGQICIAPDYILVHESKKTALLTALQEQLKLFYGDNTQASDDYMRIINTRHLDRLQAYLNDSLNKGAQLVTGAQADKNDNYLAPTIVSDVPLDSALMQEEIFGPILPVVTYKTLAEAIAYINSKEKPLALYIYSKSNKNIAQISQQTSAGTTAINNNNVHFSNNNLPFGGVNNSGIGKSHGKYGFEAFSNARAFYRQYIPGAVSFLMPPYTNFKMKLIDLTLKWF